MKLLKNIALDLWDQTLWPFVVVLLAAIVAVPLLLGAPDPEEPAVVQAAVAGTPAALAAPAQVGPAQPSLPGGRDRAGALRDPFARTVVKPRPLRATPTDVGGGGGAPAPVDGGLPSLDDLPLPPMTMPGLPPAARPPKAIPDVVTVRVGRTDEVSLREDVAVRTPLPSVDDPFLVYLGNKPDLGPAQFLVASDAVPTGDGKCRPSPESCEEIVLAEGQTEFFDVTGADGEVVQYQLDVVRIGPGGD